MHRDGQVSRGIEFTRLDRGVNTPRSPRRVLASGVSNDPGRRTCFCRARNTPCRGVGQNRRANSLMRKEPSASKQRQANDLSVLTARCSDPRHVSCSLLLFARSLPPAQELLTLPAISLLMAGLFFGN